jgi:DNA-binding response OmpR family regulator
MIILLTAKVTNDDRAEGYRAGADSFLTKPLDIKLLKARIESLPAMIIPKSGEHTKGSMPHGKQVILSSAAS